MKDYFIGLYEKAMPNTLTWRQKLECARENNFDFIEISIDETDEKLKRLDMTKEERKVLVDLMFEVGVPIRTMCLSGHRKYPLGSEDETTRKRSMEIMEKAIELADDLGIRIIQLAGYDVYYKSGNEKTRDIFFENLKKATEMASRSGIILAFETMETEFMNTVGKAMNYVEKINSPYLGVYPDCGNITNAALTHNENVIEDLKKGEGHIMAIHLKETVSGKFREIPFGTGHVNFEDIIRTSYYMGVRRFVTEFWYTGTGDYRDGIKNARSFMEDKFKNALGNL
ncbi:L-ribulose-5-phosphate 3-epimerase [Clostridium sardiniense]|uniref:L-ribulose-5-phosphate 3-epimerase n=1 Tax=Clostridium sardiniense TaxID=29369 RepID=A0ABS7KSR5_CLOSR|nr:L-ribulose-5-phosphate 3-epimerase [Clostridium sardiniense]MBY0753841.1 L-ribulose-5-phosphate 3-epimerase [Clostridium sardiniense]MDQ0459645.1 L-ribulose-5-phosphate 3-epimerase [Clostridium sardiniense]